MPVGGYLTDEARQRRLDTIALHGGNCGAAAKALDMSYSALVKWFRDLPASVRQEVLQPPNDDQCREAIEAEKRYGSQQLAAEALGLSFAAYIVRYRAALSRGLHLSEGIRDALGQTQIDAGEVRAGWRKVKDAETGSFNSVYYTVKPNPDDMVARFMAAVEAIPPVEPVPAPAHTAADLLNLIPIADAHIGLMAWHGETGQDWDTKRGGARIAAWSANVLSRMPAAATAIILLNGDSLHADSYAAETPRSRHRMDVDTRYPKALDVTVAAVVSSADRALLTHDEVIIVVLPGNHDPNASVALRRILAAYYRNEPRIKVITDDSEYFVHVFGETMIAGYHGHGAKADRITHFLAAEFPAQWGAARFRYLFTGHLHSLKQQDIGGVQWEQLPAMTKRDAWTYSGAYVQRARMSGITYHARYGEYMRVTVAEYGHEEAA